MWKGGGGGQPHQAPASPVVQDRHKHDEQPISEGRFVGAGAGVACGGAEEGEGEGHEPKKYKPGVKMSSAQHRLVGKHQRADRYQQTAKHQKAGKHQRHGKFQEVSDPEEFGKKQASEERKHLAKHRNGQRRKGEKRCN